MAGRSIRSSIRLVALASAATLLLSGCAIVSRMITPADGPASVCAQFRVAPDASGEVSAETLDATVAIAGKRLATLGVEGAQFEFLHPDQLTVSVPAGHDATWQTAISRPGVVTFVDVPPEYDQQVMEGVPLPDGIDPTPILDGTNMATAEVSEDELGKPAVSITFDEAGAADGRCTPIAAVVE